MTNPDDGCVCRGNWRKLVAEVMPNLGASYVDDAGRTFTFFGLVHAEDDYYYGLSSPEHGLKLLSCVGDIETYGYHRLMDRRWTAAQVAALAVRQRSGEIHPYTCPNRADGLHVADAVDLGVLVPTTRGWICPFCEYVQDWAHEADLKGFTPPG